MTRRCWLAVAFFLALWILGQSLLACASVPTSREGRVVVYVENHNWSDVVVYAIRPERYTRYRLGSLVTGETREFVLPNDYRDARVAFGVHLIGSSFHALDWVSEPVSVSPHAVTVVTIENSLTLSTAYLR